MKKLCFILVIALFFVACSDNSKQQLQLIASNKQDSILTRETQQKDSAIVSYVKTLDEIQSNIDSIKAKEKIVSASGNEPPHNIMNDIKSLDAKIVWENRKIYLLEKKLKKENKKDADLEKVIKHLTRELTEKDAQIADLQDRLAKSDASFKTLSAQFDDSIAVIHKQREEISAMKMAVNTVYYTLGTYQDLKKHGVISKEGSIIGIGGAAELKADFSNSSFVKGDMTKLTSIPMSYKFVKLITRHPSGAYKVSGQGHLDTLYITDPASFWSESKYLVIEVK